MPNTPSSRGLGRTRAECPVDVFAYLDVRAFLKDYYEAKKASGRSFSYRAFSRRVGLRSPNHLKRVIDGGRPLTAPMAVRYADAIGLEGEAQAYFLDLAEFSRASTSDEKNAAYARLTTYRKARSAHRLELAHAEYHSTWYLPAIRELATTTHFRSDPAWIARTLVPPVSRAQAADALKTLEQLGLLVRDADGNLTQGESVVTTGAETRGMHIANYHRTMMGRAAESIDLVHRTERDVSSLTFACSDSELREIKDRIVGFRRELIAMVSDSSSPDRVVQLNFQLFPLSQSPDRETS